MKTPIRVLIFSLLAAGAAAALPALAETLYVQPSAEIAMRRGKGTDFKVVAVIKDGTAVELLGEEDEWAQVRLEGGREGWVLRRFLSASPPPGQQIEQLQRDKEALTQTSQTLKSQLDQIRAEKGEVEGRLGADRAQAEQDLAACIAERNTINNKFLRLQQDTADVVQTKSRLEGARARVTELESQVGLLEEKNRSLGRTESLKWFLAGGGVFLLGWLIGMISRKSRKKRSTLL